MGILKFFTLSRLCRRNFDGKNLGRGFTPLIHISFKEINKKMLSPLNYRFNELRPVKASLSW